MRARLHQIACELTSMVQCLCTNVVIRYRREWRRKPTLVDILNMDFERRK